jgi:hypothetical protein
MRKLPVLEIKEKPAGLRLAAHKGLRGCDHKKHAREKSTGGVSCQTGFPIYN